MSEDYFNLKAKLEDLGYNNHLPTAAVPLVECLVADLLQTTRSLQHYMDLAQDAIKQRDALVMEAEPYKCENAKLLQENSELHINIMTLKEDYDKLGKESRRKIKAMCEELIKKDKTITRLQHDLKELNLRGICADTLSSRNKSRRKDYNDIIHGHHSETTKTVDRDLIELNTKVSALEELTEAYRDEMDLLKRKVEHRDNEIIRLNMMLEGGRPKTVMVKDCCRSDHKVEELKKELNDIERSNDLLKKEYNSSIDKQHEAMLRAIDLADKNKKLQEELNKVDNLALKVEQDGNMRINSILKDLQLLQTKVENLTIKNAELQKELSEYKSCSPKRQNNAFEENLSSVLKEKEMLKKEIKTLTEINKSLQENIQILTHDSFNTIHDKIINVENEKGKFPTKTELHNILEIERKKYEQYLQDIQQKLSDTLNNFNKHVVGCGDNKPQRNTNKESSFVKHLHDKLCKSEQKILLLKKENDELKNKIITETDGTKQNYKDIISQLNAENAELSKENISLSQQLSLHRNSGHNLERNEYSKKELKRLKEEVETMKHEIIILKKDKQEYNFRCKEAIELTEKLKRDLAYKQKEIEKLEEENSSYKLTNRTGKASTDHLKEECSFLREQMKRIQSDMIKEKTLANQIKNIQLETERSSNELQNELICVQKQLHLSKDTVQALEKKCKDLQDEIISLKNDKSNLLDNIRKVDQDRDKLIIELDNKTETICVLEQKLKSETYEKTKLICELSESKRKLNLSKVAEHKLSDSEAQIAFLNGEILRLQQKFDSAIIENKHLQNSLADANGALKLSIIEYDKSRKEVDGLKQQLQHYVAEIRRIEELLSHKEAERSDMLEHFASLSVEANILENTNHSLESESVSKSLKLQSNVSKIEILESKLMEKENIIESQSKHIASLQSKVTSLENEIKLMSEEKTILEQNVGYLKQMCTNLNSLNPNGSTGKGDTESEFKLYENKIKSLSREKSMLQVENDYLKQTLSTTENLLSNARHEVVDLKLALQDATRETKSLHERFLNRRDEIDIHESIREELELPLMLEETIHEVGHEEEEESSRYQQIHKRYSKISHGSTL